MTDQNFCICTGPILDLLKLDQRICLICSRQVLGGYISIGFKNSYCPCSYHSISEDKKEMEIKDEEKERDESSEEDDVIITNT